MHTGSGLDSLLQLLIHTPCPALLPDQPQRPVVEGASRRPCGLEAYWRAFASPSGTAAL